MESKTQTPLDKDGKPLQQSGNSIIGYRETLKLLYNANDELAQSTKINQQGFEIVTTTTKYHYDAFGRRIAKSSESKKQNKLSPHTGQLLAVEKAVQQDKTEKQTTLMLWDGNRQAQEYTDRHEVLMFFYTPNKNFLLKYDPFATKIIHRLLLEGDFLSGSD